MDPPVGSGPLPMMLLAGASCPCDGGEPGKCCGSSGSEPDDLPCFGTAAWASSTSTSFLLLTMPLWSWPTSSALTLPTALLLRDAGADGGTGEGEVTCRDEGCRLESADADDDVDDGGTMRG